MDPIQQRLDSIDLKLNSIITSLAQGVVTIPPDVNANGAIPAYDLPALGVNDIKADEQFVNRDGSVWVMSSGFSPTGGSTKPVPVLKYYGYISPKKCPELFEQAHRSLGAEAYAEFVAQWQQHKYGIYSSNPGLDATLDGNSFMFYFRVHFVADHPQ